MSYDLMVFEKTKAPAANRNSLHRLYIIKQKILQTK